MASSSPIKEIPVKGYVSDEAKKRFTTAAGIAGAVFLIGQMVVPFIGMIIFMPFVVFTGLLDFKQPRISHGAIWEGKFWYVDNSTGFGPGSRRQSDLKSLDPEGDESAEKVVSLDFANPMLLSAGEGLWIISRDKVGVFDGKNVVQVHETEELGDSSNPFVLDGHPTVIENMPTGPVLKSFRKDKWEETSKLELGRRDVDFDSDVFYVLPGQDAMHVFVQFGSEVFYRRGLPLTPEEDDENWQRVHHVDMDWAAGLAGDTPFLIFQELSPFNDRIMGMIQKGKRWKEFFSLPCGAVMDMGVYPTGDPDKFYLMLHGMPTSFRLLTVENGTVVAKKRFGGWFPFPTSIVFFFFMPFLVLQLAFPFVIVIVLSGMMFKYRVSTIPAGDGVAEFASLTRRAVAQIIDGVVFAVPLSVPYLVFFRNMDEGFGTAMPFAMFLAFGLTGAMGIILMLVFSFLEGRWGRTPGKWIVGIKVVGMDLQPCGFLRALIRNLLKLIDGIYNFMLAILVVALTENWQRLGDLAARTIVIRVGSKTKG